MNSIAHDSFNECFESPRKEKRPLYKLPGTYLSLIFSVVFRVPIRSLIFFSNLLICGFLISIIGIVYPFDTVRRQKILLTIYQLAAKLFVISFGGEIHLHGTIPKYSYLL